MRSCRRMKSIRHGSWFSGSHLSIEKILEITFLWCEDIEQRVVKKWVEVAEHTIVDWCHFCREVCAIWYNDHTGTDQIGGPGTVVEIDESMFGKRKYHVGRVTQGKWVLGGVERGTDNMFMVMVPSRDAATLLPLIQRYVKPGTTIHTDGWAAYNGLPALGYTHHTVNHSVNFVDPVTGTHTQSIEGSWYAAKRKLKRGHGTSRQLFASYLMEYMWRREYGKEFTFANFIRHISYVYKV